MRRLVFIFLLFPTLLLGQTRAEFPVHPNISVLLSPGMAPATIHVNGLRFVPAVGTVLTARYEWDFGDVRGKFNRLTGFNAAHVYDQPGKYTISLKVTDEAGAMQGGSVTVTIVPDMRSRIFVSPEGVDANNGLSPEAPVHTLARAMKLTRDDTEVLLKAGAMYQVEFSLQLHGQNVVVDRYDDGADPLILRIKGGGNSTFSPDPKCNGLTFQHLKFDSPYPVQADGQAPKIGTSGIAARGRNITVRDCTFLNMDDAINCASSPIGLLVQGCTAPLVTGLRGYLIWAQGTDHVYLGNSAANSTREHIVRMTAIQRVLIAENDFTNLDRRPDDKYDIAKGTIEAHLGSYIYISHNNVSGGTIRVGPLGGKDEPPTSATDMAVVEANTLRDTYLPVYVGAHHIVIRNNIIYSDNRQAIVINGPDSFGRESGDITVVNNTNINNSTVGAFMKVWGPVNGMVVRNNLMVGPNLKVGNGSGTAAMNIAEDDLSSFTEISHNVWPKLGAPGRVCVVEKSKTGKYISTEQWAGFAQVKRDVFADVAVDDRGAPSGDEVQHGQPTAGVVCDHDGIARLASGVTIGAIQVSPEATTENAATEPVLSPTTK